MDAEAEEVLNELNMLTSGGSVSTGSSAPNAGGESADGGSSLVLGELAQLTVNNEADVNSYDGSGNTKGNLRKLWCAKFTLRSHFDSVRALTFHPQDPVLITASDDHTLKFWNIHKTVQAKKSPSLDVEPLYTFRAHTGPVLCVAMSGNGEYCYSGGLDSAIHCWKLPNSYIDPYDSYDPSVLKGTLDGHTDAVWGLSVNSGKSYLASFSADETVKLWSPQAKVPLLQTFVDAQLGTPTSVDFVRDEMDRIVVAYRGAQLVTYDTETGKQLLKFDNNSNNSSSNNNNNNNNNNNISSSNNSSKQDSNKATSNNSVNSNNSITSSTTTTTTTSSSNSNINNNNDNSSQSSSSSGAAPPPPPLLAPVSITTAASAASCVSDKFIYKVVSHPTLPITITAHHDRHIRFWDTHNGTLIHSMVAHLDAVTSLAVDPKGLCLLSGSHDNSIRLWDLDNKTCIQEITAHRKKFDESILDVAFHPSRGYIASGGADSLAKVFV